MGRAQQADSRTDPLGRTTRYSYDDDGNLTGVSGTSEIGTQSRAEYNEWGLPTSVVDPDGAVWRQSYDERGNRVSLTDPTGATTRYSYDERATRPPSPTRSARPAVSSTIPPDCRSR